MANRQTSEMTVEQKLKHYRLTLEEYELMKKYLAHEPNKIEWALYSALWSEHCSYKSSKVHLKKLFTKHPRVAQGPGENAGVIDLGLGERVAFKMESHNHPSFIEPTQGAATGVGGILRDIFTMGARPMASMDYLCFGEVSDPQIPRLLNGVVKGIGGYGNCVGVPTVSGQTTFHKSYNKNNLVNAFALGLFRPNENIFYGKPNVQIGDPFLEKLLIEACLDVMKEKLVVGIQDMGAAGLTSSTFEMASRAQSGLKMDLKKVPLREADITPEEILLSESQERMILVVESSKYKRVEEIFKKWDLSCNVIGEITTGDNVELYWGQELLAKVSHKPLVDKAPLYERPYELPHGPRIQSVQLESPSDFSEEAKKFLASSAMTSRLWITKQYDQRVGAKTVSACEDGVALLRLPDSGRTLGMATGCRPLLMEWDCETGAKDAVVLPVLQLASRGVRALACTDCLNFGNPEKKNIMGQLVASLKALDSACRAFDVPIISGNVSLYNETLGENIVPTPSTGIVGLRDQPFGPSGSLVEENLELYLVRTLKESSWVGEYANFKGKMPQGSAQVDFSSLVTLQNVFLQLVLFAKASQVVSKGGLFGSLVKLSELGTGLDINFEEKNRSPIETLFAERFYAGVWAFDSSDVTELQETCDKHRDHIALQKIGVSGGDKFKFNTILDLSLREIHLAKKQGLERWL
jgi:phosphoribosylformylglycinamidine synthase II